MPFNALIYLILQLSKARLVSLTTKQAINLSIRLEVNVPIVIFKSFGKVFITTKVYAKVTAIAAMPSIIAKASFVVTITKT